MEATIVKDESKHYPVLLNEIISVITPQHGGTFIDCTFGQGGYTKKILDFPDTKVIALDRDIDTKKNADLISGNFEHRFLYKNLKFSEISNLKLKNENIKGIVFDLGYSYPQIKNKSKGLSFSSIGELDMKMGLNSFSAKDVINKLGEEELTKIFKTFGEEIESKFIARNIIKERKKKIIDTPKLVEIIEKTKRKKNYKINNSTKVFQALRIFVNKEISELIYGLINATKVLKKDGVLVVVTFHSLEDKIVKYFFKSLSENKTVSRYLPENKDQNIIFELKEKKPILPSEIEINENPPSRSAKLRYVKKSVEIYDIKTDILDKFQNLLDVEKIGESL
ncbi:S-adenosyl-methyltransferase MraW [alpha proteobacterium HIMB5]|nr:S-adenosyl-methyltransferase MraW [alpha proteobacterium HIMB5]